MSWNDNNNQSKNPWGGKSPGRRGDNPPDLEELFKRSQEHLRSIMPGGGQGGGFFDFLRNAFFLFLLVMVWSYMSVYRIEPDENGVVLRLGSYNRTTPSGLTFILWPIERLEKVKVKAENQINFGEQGQGSALMLAGDQNIVNVEFSVLWKISNAEEYLFNILDQEQLVARVSESAMREVVGRTNADEIRTKGRQVAQEQVRDLIQKTLDFYKSGIVVSGVQLKKADPPPQVIDAFEEVQRAEQNQDKLIREAERYRNQLIGQSRGGASKITEDAKAYKSRVVAEAQGEAQRFLSVYNAYQESKGVTRERMFIETMEEILQKTQKVILGEGKGNGQVLPYLPLPALRSAPMAQTKTKDEVKP